jgi:hypothetical protein
VPPSAFERHEVLTFKIDDGSALAVLSELGPYESGQMETPEHGFVVFIVSTLRSLPSPRQAKS